MLSMLQKDYVPLSACFLMHDWVRIVHKHTNGVIVIHMDTAVKLCDD